MQMPKSFIIITGILIAHAINGCALTNHRTEQPKAGQMTRLCPDGSTVTVDVPTGDKLTYLTLSAAKNRATAQCLRKNNKHAFVSGTIRSR